MKIANESLSDFKVAYLSEQDIPKCIKLASNCFEDFKTSPGLINTWFNQRVVNNPWQKALPGIGIGIKHNEKLIAFRAMFAQPWWLNGTETIIAFCANTAVDEAYRGKGLASLMIAESKNFAAVSGSTTAGFITQKAYKKLGFNEIGGTDNDFFKLRASYKGSVQKRFGLQLGSVIGQVFDIKLFIRDFINKPNAKFYLSEINRCDEEFDLFWERIKWSYFSCLEHSSHYLNWRLFDYPTCPLYLSALRDSSDALRAYGIWHITQFSGDVKMAVLRDVFYDPIEEDAAKGLVYCLIDQWRSEGISWVNLEVASPTITALFKHLKYEHVPSRGNRYHIFSNPPIEPAILENWHRSGLDGDYFDLPFL